jgi:hypothetical protein
MRPWLFALAMPALALAVATGCGGTPTRAGTGSGFPPPTKTSGCQAHSAEPDTACTPGAVFPDAAAAQICVPGYAARARDVGVEEKRQAYSEYGLAYPQAPGAYEADHLVPLELGGSNDLANLWPEAASPPPGFHEKDGLEDWLHDQVCAGAIDLTTAQQEIATDWLSVWQAAGQPAPSYSGGNTGDLTPRPPDATAAPSLPVAVTPAPTSTPSTTAGDGHTYYASKAPNATTIYCDDDPVWQTLSTRNLVSFQGLDAAMAAFPSYHLHQPC